MPGPAGGGPERPRVAFLGPAGTHTEEALRASAAGPVEEVPIADVRGAVMAVQDGSVDACVLPIENSLEGSVTATLDALAAKAVEVRIVAEVIHPVHHCLIARPGTAIGSVERVISHPHATAQCSRFLLRHLPATEHVAAASTADAVRALAESDSSWAALGSRLAAELYGCVVLADSVEDSSDNVTRFVWLASASGGAAGRMVRHAGAGRAKTSIVFWGFDDDSPGALVAVLDELARRQVNLTKIESRPGRVRFGHYMFFVDLDGAEADPPVADALAALDRRVETLKVLGSYTTADLTRIPTASEARGGPDGCG